MMIFVRAITAFLGALCLLALLVIAAVAMLVLFIYEAAREIYRAVRG